MQIVIHSSLGKLIAKPMACVDIKESIPEQTLCELTPESKNSEEAEPTSE